MCAVGGNCLRRGFSYPKNFIKYLGTGGARFCMIRQMRWTGGIWFSYGALNGVIDPGPGSLYHICSSSPALDVTSLDVILLTHRHLDHSSDINVMIEAVTDGGYKKHGMIIIPRDAIDSSDPVVLNYSAQKIKSVQIAEDKLITELSDGVTVEAVTHVHNKVDCCGYIFRKEGLRTWGIISDTKPLPIFKDRYKECDFISINATFLEKSSHSDHMSIDDVVELLKKVSPKLTAISHMGIRILKRGPKKLAKKLSTKNTKVVAGEDGMVINLDNLKVFSPIKNKKIKIERYKAI